MLKENLFDISYYNMPGLLKRAWPFVSHRNFYLVILKKCSLFFFICLKKICSQNLMHFYVFVSIYELWYFIFLKDCNEYSFLKEKKIDMEHLIGNVTVLQHVRQQC